MNTAHGGDLDNLVGEFINSNRYPPELSLWHLFRALVTSCWHLENGEPLYENQGDDPNWEEEFVHRDPKMANVPLRIPEWETPLKVIPDRRLLTSVWEFSHHGAIQENPHMFDGYGTLGFMAPEMPWQGAQMFNGRKLLARTNV